MKVITFANEKGGVGKTTLAVHFAAGLAMAGKRVVLIDSDPQANATQLTGLEESGGLYDLLVRKAKWKALLQPSVLDDNLFVLPGNVETSVIASVLKSQTLLHERLSDLDGVVDVVIIDTSPVPSMLHSLIYMATDGIIYPTQLETLSISGLGKTVDNLAGMREKREQIIGKTIQMLGVVPTMVNAQSVEHQVNYDELVGLFGEAYLWTKMGRRVAWAEASKNKRAIWDYAPNTPASHEALDFVTKGAQYV